MKNFYFAGAIRGGRAKVEEYAKIVRKLQEYGNVLTTHVASADLDNNGEKNLTKKEIYDRDMKWLNESDLVVAEVSIPSLGVGYELAAAEKLDKKVICFFCKDSDKTLSAMIEGDEYFTVVYYNNIDEVLTYLEDYLSSNKV